MAAAAPALIERVEPNWAIDRTTSQAARAASDSPGPSWPSSSTQARGRAWVSSGTAPGRLSTPSTGSPDADAQVRRSSALAWWCRCR